MPRKPKEHKRKIVVVVNGNPVAVVLHPPGGNRRSWYAYWPGLVASRSTGTADPDEAALVVENMLKNGGKKPECQISVPTDEEFEEIQRRH
ncbi:MAG TPA: hypothetical protein VFT74_02395, partial [Isosphaeraceae bacterium]|nr:hypothetical protein [Isosphaeraceae bacterium]